jgi:hypothetical protein
VLKILKGVGITRLQAQVCVHSGDFGTAADITGYSSKLKKGETPFYSFLTAQTKNVTEN